MDFGSVVVGQSSTRAIAVTNNGTASLTVSNVTSSNSQFAQMDSFAPFTVQPGGSQSITFRFTPTAAGTPVGQIVISSNAPGQTTVQVNVSGTATSVGGTGGGGGTNLLCNGSFEQPGTTAGFVTLETGSTAMPCWRVVSGNIDFVHRSYWTPSDGNISLDMNGNTAGVIAQTFTTTPNGVYTVTFDLAGAPGAPVKQLQVSAAGQSSNRTFDSTNKSATNMGWSRETFTFTANAASTTLQFSSLSGVTSFGPALDNVCVVAGTGSCSGTGGGTGTPSIGLTPTSVNFGSVVVGQSVTRTVAVTNTGAGPLTVSFVSSTNSQFAPIDSFPPFTVAPGASQTMTFRFTPTQVGTPSGTVTISSNAFNLPSAQFSVSGTATAAGGGGGGTLPAITFGQTINGTLTSATPGRASDCSNCYADIYQLTVTASRTIVITLNSAVFDAYLNVIDASGRIVGSDDDSGGGLNARVSGTITPGVYRIEVTTANDRETGSYTLSIAP